MSVQFNPTTGPVQIRGVLVGPVRATVVRFTLDTGASHTSIRPHILRLVGYDPTVGRPRRLRSATGSGQGRALNVSRLIVLGVDRSSFEVTAHDLPPALVTDGLLGLDFLRAHVLTVNFARGRVALRQPAWWRFWAA